MPSHPDRVRRHYLPERPRVPLHREILEGEAVCTVCGSGLGSHVLAERGHPFAWRRPSDTAAEQLLRRSAVVVVDSMHPEHCTACDRYHLPPVGPECPYMAITDTGFTANVIEGDPY